MLCGCSSSQNDLADRTVLKVNDDVLTLGEFAKQLGRELKGLDALTAKDKSTMKRAKKAIIRNFITTSLSNRWAKEHNIFVRKESLEAEITTIRGFYPDDLAFRRALANEGLSFTEWSAKLKYTLLQKMLIQEITKEIIPPEDEELLSYYNRHIEEFLEPTRNP